VLLPPVLFMGTLEGGAPVALRLGEAG
jgi:hypothetical protein